MVDLAVHFNAYRHRMNISLLYFDGCPNWKIADERLAAIAAERPDVTVNHQLVDSVEEAERLGFHGSPSILLEGADVFADPDAAVALSCRMYQTPRGPAGAPTLDQLREVILGA